LTDTYRLRLESARRDATLKQNETRVNPSTIESSLSGLEDLLKQRWIDSEDMERVESLGRTLGEDIVQDLDPSLAAELALAGDRDLHMQLQIPPPLMRYPWELMHDGQAWLSERYALGRQVFMEQSAVRWAARRRCGGLRVLIIGDPLLQDQIGVSMDFDRRRDVRIHQVLTRDECRRILRSGAYDIIHFAGHAFFDRDDPLRSGWILSDGALWAQEIRNTLMRTTPPWLVYANACEAAMDAQGPAAKYQGDVYGLTSIRSWRSIA
jgi:CHAT domain-containing protein